MWVGFIMNGILFLSVPALSAASPCPSILALGGERGWPAVGLKLIIVSVYIGVFVLSDGGGRVWASLVAVDKMATIVEGSRMYTYCCCVLPVAASAAG